jgi:hypothetical protein
VNKATRAQFMAVVKLYGATVDERDPSTFYVDAPKGKVWMCDVIHTLAHQHNNNHGHSWKAEAYADAIERMEWGLEDCTEPNCDICNEE